jgi:hypothetical protein
VARRWRWLIAGIAIGLCGMAKAVCGIVAYGFLAFAVTRIDPVVPLMREKVRYYFTAAPVLLSRRRRADRARA